MKLGPVTKLNNRNKTTSKKIDDDAMSENLHFIAIFPINDQFGALRKLDYRRKVCKTYIFINSYLLYCAKTENRTQKFLTQLSHYCFE